MKKEDDINAFVSDGGWKTVEGSQKSTVYGFMVYCICEILFLPLCVFITIVHIKSNENIFTLENTGPFVLGGFILQLFLIYKLTKTFGTKTRTETTLYKTEISNPDYDQKNLY